MQDWNTWKWLIIPEIILVVLVLLSIWRDKMFRKNKIERNEKKQEVRRLKEFKRQGFVNEEWSGYSYMFISRQRKLITALRDKSIGYKELLFEELENIAQEDKIPSGLQITPQTYPERWKAILSLMLYYLDRMDESSSYNVNPLDDEFYAVFVSREVQLNEEEKEKLQKNWTSKNDKIERDIEKYKNRFFRLLSKYFFYMYD